MGRRCWREARCALSATGYCSVARSVGLVPRAGRDCSTRTRGRLSLPQETAAPEPRLGPRSDFASKYNKHPHQRSESYPVKGANSVRVSGPSHLGKCAADASLPNGDTERASYSSRRLPPCPAKYTLLAERALSPAATVGPGAARQAGPISIVAGGGTGRRKSRSVLAGNCPH